MGVNDAPDWGLELHFGRISLGIIETNYYDQNGNNISEMSASISAPYWMTISPDSIGEAEFDAIYARVPN